MKKLATRLGRQKVGSMVVGLLVGLAVGATAMVVGSGVLIDPPDATFTATDPDEDTTLTFKLTQDGQYGAADDLTIGWDTDKLFINAAIETAPTVARTLQLSCKATVNDGAATDCFSTATKDVRFASRSEVEVASAGMALTLPANPSDNADDVLKVTVSGEWT